MSGSSFRCLNSRTAVQLSSRPKIRNMNESSDSKVAMMITKTKRLSTDRLFSTM